MYTYVTIEVLFSSFILMPLYSSEETALHRRTTGRSNSFYCLSTADTVVIIPKIVVAFISTSWPFVASRNAG